MKRWMLTAKLLIEEPMTGETKAEALVFGVGQLTEAIKKALPTAKVVVTFAKADEDE